MMGRGRNERGEGLGGYPDAEPRGPGGGVGTDLGESAGGADTGYGRRDKGEENQTTDEHGFTRIKAGIKSLILYPVSSSLQPET